MTKRDDCTLSPEDSVEVRHYADRLLRKADAYGRFPTPISDLVAAAKLSVESGVALDAGLLTRSYQKATSVLKRALSKVLAFLDARDPTIYIDQSVHPKKRPFITLHDTAHDFLSWQRDTYAILEEDESTLDPEVQDLFERQANVFASDVLFQLNAFQEQAADHPFSIRTPVQLSKRFGSSCYAAARRYVVTNQRACALIVLNIPMYEVRTGYTTTVRRYLQSPKFTERFGYLRLPASYGPNHLFTSLFPGRSPFSERFFCRLTNLNHELDTCLGEAFNSGYEIFILLYPEKALKPAVVPAHL